MMWPSTGFLKVRTIDNFKYFYMELEISTCFLSRPSPVWWWLLIGLQFWDCDWSRGIATDRNLDEVRLASHPVELKTKINKLSGHKNVIKSICLFGEKWGLRLKSLIIVSSKTWLLTIHFIQPSINFNPILLFI